MVRYLSQNLETFSIIILDENLNILNEVLMPKNKYAFGKYFINKDGLNINANHINNKGFDEDFLIYHTYQFVENEKR